MYLQASHPDYDALLLFAVLWPLLALCFSCRGQPRELPHAQKQNTALHKACIYGHTELAVKLVELGADVNAVNKVGFIGGV